MSGTVLLFPTDRARQRSHGDLPAPFVCVCCGRARVEQPGLCATCDEVRVLRAREARQLQLHADVRRALNADTAMELAEDGDTPMSRASRCGAACRKFVPAGKRVAYDSASGAVMHERCYALSQPVRSNRRVAFAGLRRVVKRAQLLALRIWGRA